MCSIRLSIMIQLALKNNYNVCSMIEFYNNPQDGKHFVLRHDVDHKSPATKRMFHVERSLGVHSTYYFRKSTLDVCLMNEMIDCGFEVGFHYETLSDYALEKRLDEVNETDIQICKERLKSEIMEFNSLIKRPISSIVGHGARKNLEIEKSNNVLLEGRDYQDFGILFEGYDEKMYEEHVNAHIMDGNIRRNYGFSYNTNPIVEIKSGKQNIIFLAHPNHWYKTFPQKCWDLTAFLIGRCSYSTAMEFKRIMRGEGN